MKIASGTKCVRGFLLQYTSNRPCGKDSNLCNLRNLWYKESNKSQVIMFFLCQIGENQFHNFTPLVMH